jgi:hypothetical protein
MSSALRGTSEARRLTAPCVYNAGAFIELDSDDRRMWARHKLALDEARDIHVPAVVVGQAWRDARRQVRLGRVLADVQVDPAGLDTSNCRNPVRQVRHIRHRRRDTGGHGRCSAGHHLDRRHIGHLMAVQYPRRPDRSPGFMRYSAVGADLVRL